MPNLSQIWQNILNHGRSWHRNQMVQKVLNDDKKDQLDHVHKLFLLHDHKDEGQTHGDGVHELGGVLVDGHIHKQGRSHGLQHGVRMSGDDPRHS